MVAQCCASYAVVGFAQNLGRSGWRVGELWLSSLASAGCFLVITLKLSSRIDVEAPEMPRDVIDVVRRRRVWVTLSVDMIDLLDSVRYKYIYLSWCFQS